jgi:predicted nucleotidyltransferase
MDGAPTTEVARRLDTIERDHDVRVLFACESGSRAWGFPSQDSDYDVRFVYAHSLDWYLSIAERRDVIETPIEGLWDINGWDLRKALGLLAKSNPPLLEWLHSPIVYRRDEGFTARLLELADHYYSPRSCRLHYLSMANANHRQYLVGDVVWRKKYFYILRPLFACRWIERALGPVPTEFDALLRAVDLPTDVIEVTERLLAEKRAGTEKGQGPAEPVLNAFIVKERAHQESLGGDWAQEPPKDHAPLDAFFREVVNP